MHTVQRQVCFHKLAAAWNRRSFMVVLKRQICTAAAAVLTPLVLNSSDVSALSETHRQKHTGKYSFDNATQ